MIGLLRGTIVESAPDGTITLDVGGVGYELATPLGTAGRLRPDPDGRVALVVQTSVRQDAIALYGFADRDDRTAFRALVSVAGARRAGRHERRRAGGRAREGRSRPPRLRSRDREEDGPAPAARAQGPARRGGRPRGAVAAAWHGAAGTGRPAARGAHAAGVSAGRGRSCRRGHRRQGPPAGGARAGGPGHPGTLIY
ncbi:MAG: hypothetical protein HY744_31090 [Deltaproteobacteria bacterium]|nr:hypothetical protein [Deltaproteobacteria bacterium]